MGSARRDVPSFEYSAYIMSKVVGSSEPRAMLRVYSYHRRGAQSDCKAGDRLRSGAKTVTAMCRLRRFARGSNNRGQIACGLAKSATKSDSYDVWQDSDSTSW
jgi:hypothetical protein